MSNEINFEEYKAIKAINASFLKACSFGAYQGYKQLHEPSYESDAMAMGSAVHCAVLEPDKFLERYAISEKFDRRTKAGKEAAAAFEAANVGKFVIDSEDASKIERIRTNCLAIPQIREAIERFDKEKSITWGDGQFKARLDLCDAVNGVVIDLKTTRSADQREFTNQLISLRYDIQLLHYCKAINATAAYAIAVEVESGEVAMYDLTDIVFSDFTKNRYEVALKTANYVLQLDKCPPKFSTEIISLTLPKWAESEVV